MHAMVYWLPLIMSSAGTHSGFRGAHRWTATPSRLFRSSKLLPHFNALFFLCIFFTLIELSLFVSPCRAQTSRWVTAYYAGWVLGTGSNGYLPVSKVDFSAFTHVIHFCLVVRSDGTLDTVGNTITKSGGIELVKAAHAHNVRVLISIGGAYSEPGFSGATDTAKISRFVHNIMVFVRNVGYDGVDIDWEPINPEDYDHFTNLATLLRDSLRTMSATAVLTTTCVDGNQKIMDRDQDLFDQINIMTYDMSFPSSGWVVWYNSPLFNGGLKFPGLDEYVPSIDAEVKNFEAAGVAPGKIGIGAEFGGTVWKGVTLPGELLTGLLSVQYDVPLYWGDGSGIMQKYYNAADYHWDASAQVGYLSIGGLLGIGGEFISYDDSNSIRAKAHYIDSTGIGGIILYELGMGYPGDGTYPLIESVKSSFQSTLRALPPLVPYSAVLQQNYPNPFNPSTSITFKTFEPEQVNVAVYDLLGRKVVTLVEGFTPPGTHTVQWNAAGLPSGVYFCRLLAGPAQVSKKMLHIQ
jgi:chitinase